MKGFNYSPSYSPTAFGEWDKFDAEVWRTEIGRGKKYFPKMNTLRIWLDWNTYRCIPEKAVKGFGSVLDIADEFDIKIMPTLFDRWHDPTDDIYEWGGIYLEHFADHDFTKFESFIKDIVGTFKNDDRIVMWDLCNEPKINPMHKRGRPPLREHDWLHWGKDTVREVASAQLELEWLRWVADMTRKAGATQPITMGVRLPSEVECVADFLDVLCFHPYRGEDIPIGRAWEDAFARLCDVAVEIAQRKGKPLIANETCTGSLDDKKREEIIHRSLGPLKERGIGWCCWILHGGLHITCNREATDTNAPLGDRGYMAFIEADGSLRPGSEACNEY